MSDYINREKIAAEARELSTHLLNEWDTMGVLALIDRQPAADVVEVVRCKDCRYSYEEPHPTRIAHRVCAYGVCVDCEVEDDFYCANGAKMDESEDEDAEIH